MRKGYIYVYYGEGRGKTTLAVGQGVRAVGEELSVIMIQFLDYNNNKESIPLKKLEPDFKVFRFEKMRNSIEDADEAVKKEVYNEVQTAFNFTKKILETGECDMLILDGIVDAIEKGYLSEASLCESLERKPSYMDVIISGSTLTDGIRKDADFIYKICTEKLSVEE